jgi:hypothetical protein
MLLLALILSLAPVANAELTSKEREQVKEIIKGDLYLRTTIPMRYTSGRGGIGSAVLVEVSPTAIDCDKNMPPPVPDKKNRIVDTVYWGFGPNDVIRYGKLYFKGSDTVDLWAEGVKPKDIEVMIRFVQIKTVDDFKKAFDQVLSNKPLQDEHRNWPEEVRKAIADRKVIEGMTKAQASAVVGTPVGIESHEEAGKNVETWFLRQDTGALGDGTFFWGRTKTRSTTTGFPAFLRFVDGKVVAIGQPGGNVKLAPSK